MTNYERLNRENGVKKGLLHRRVREKRLSRILQSYTIGEPVFGGREYSGFLLDLGTDHYTYKDDTSWTDGYIPLSAAEMKRLRNLPALKPLALKGGYRIAGSQLMILEGRSERLAAFSDGEETAAVYRLTVNPICESVDDFLSCRHEL